MAESKPSMIERVAASISVHEGWNDLKSLVRRQHNPGELIYVGQPGARKRKERLRPIQNGRGRHVGPVGGPAREIRVGHDAAPDYGVLEPAELREAGRAGDWHPRGYRSALKHPLTIVRGSVPPAQSRARQRARDDVSRTPLV